MSVLIKSLATNDLIAGTSDAAVDTLYFGGNVTAQINMASCYNLHTSAVTVYFYIVAFGVAAADVEPICKQSIASGESAIVTGLIGHAIPKNGALMAWAGTTNVIQVHVSGIEVT